MEFKFRAGDPRSPPPPLQCAPPMPPLQCAPPMPPLQCAPPMPPPGFCLPKQGFPDAYLGRTTNMATLRTPFDTNEVMHCEMELMRLRQEKLVLEIERQRFLEEDARRELMLFERERAICEVAQSVGYPLRQPQPWGVPFAAAGPSLSPSPAVMVQSFQEWQRMDKAKSSECLGFGPAALPPRIQPFMAEHYRERQVVQPDENKLIVLEKPDPNVFREKRKAEMASTSSDNVQSSYMKKTPKGELSCALCQVTVTNEKVFNEHLHGKKHKRREAGLRAQNASKLFQAAPPEPLSYKRMKLEKTFGSAGAIELKESKDGETLQGEKTEGSFVTNALIPNFLESGDKEDNEQQNQQNQNNNLENLLKSGEKEDDKQENLQNQNQNLQNFLKSDDMEDNKQPNLQNFPKSDDGENNKQQSVHNPNLQNFPKSDDREDNNQQSLHNSNLQNFPKSDDGEDNKQQILHNPNLQNFPKSDDREDNNQQSLHNPNLQNFLNPGEIEDDNKQQNLQSILESGDEEEDEEQNVQNLLKSGENEDNTQQNLQNLLNSQQNQNPQNLLNSQQNQNQNLQNLVNLQQNQAVFGQNFTTEDLLAAKKKFKFWCKKCKVGAYAAGVMVAHLNGKKHQANLQQPDQTWTGRPF
ncbi:zinc finger protein 830-like isoform X2 [Cucurbita maxima]|uniref:Zinc finger protein 830-like isoform X2 n=1 Tax=Cucurbita maxima TaxID=3661 RepID=A0A6J1KHP4_CUCMA|nr:zinc finger protein 830-like isoform X2 [Cucurbita maxima]